MSWINIKNQIITFATTHAQINSVGFGDPLSIGTDNCYNLRALNRERIVFPLLFADVQTCLFQKGQSTLTINVLIMDQVRDSKKLEDFNGESLINEWKDNEDEILNDSLYIFSDLISYFIDNPDLDYSLSPNVTAQRFIEGRDDKVAGWQGNLSFVLPYGGNVCLIPTL